MLAVAITRFASLHALWWVPLTVVEIAVCYFPSQVRFHSSPHHVTPCNVTFPTISWGRCTSSQCYKHRNPVCSGSTTPLTLPAVTAAITLNLPLSFATTPPSPTPTRLRMPSHSPTQPSRSHCMGCSESAPQYIYIYRYRYTMPFFNYPLPSKFHNNSPTL